MLNKSHNEFMKLILESQRMLLWENWRKWDRINRKHGGGGCVETNEIVELIKRINNLIEPQNEELTLPEKTKDALNVKEVSK